MSKKEYAKCKKCGHFFAAELVKDNLCPDCQEKPEQQKIYTIEELEKLIGTPEERMLMPDGSTEPKYKQVKPEPSGDTLQKEMIKEAMEAIEQRRPGRAKLVYDKKSRTIIAVPTEQTSGFVFEVRQAIIKLTVAAPDESDENLAKWIRTLNKAADYIEQLEANLEQAREVAFAWQMKHQERREEVEQLEAKFKVSEAENKYKSEKIEQLKSKKHITLTQAHEMALFSVEKARQRQQWVDVKAENKELTERIKELEAEKGVTDGKPKIH